MSYPKIRMVLFFTRYVPLQLWHQQGLLNREIAIYQKLRDYNVQTSFITYGGRDDIRLAHNVMDIPIHANYLSLNPKRYEHNLHWVHMLPLLRADVIKTNQINGAQYALRAARLWNKPLIARFGYMFSHFEEQYFGEDSPQALGAYRLEETVFKSADAIIGTSQRMKDDIDRRFDNLPVHVLPNYVDTEQFKPLDIPKDVDITFVGRFHDQKNLFALLEAISKMDVTCRLIGNGELKSEFESEFGDLDGRLTFYGHAPHEDLPTLMNASRIFVLPSHYEGHPKALIEAMSCGCAVIGTDVIGTREVIQHGQTGWLCETSAESLQNAIETLIENETLRQTLGDNARLYVLENYDLDVIATKEYQIIRQVVDKSQKK